jgi:cellulose synthase/poly-beta-1,6-N-acetylglucosamine synthase-like glycosyltransferase
VTTRDQQTRAAALNKAIAELFDTQPMLSSRTTFVPWQRSALVMVSTMLIVAFVLWPRTIATVCIGAATLLYVANLVDRTWLFATGVERSPAIVVSEEVALAVPDEELPRYSVLVPAFHEPTIIERVVRELALLDYPRDKIDIKLLLEADDDATIAAAQRALHDAVLLIDLVLVPAAEPRTKPKACNFGLEFASGEFVTIYDAEDIPEPLQLRRAVVAFRALGPEVACVQAKLSYHNDRQNLLTRWFTSEYNQWFGFTLPGLMAARAPIPLGGTSNHLRTDILRTLGGWDPFNVTEDADLGIRLWRQGYATAILDSVTLEEANSDPINWVRQRSRWYKGYLQTFLVHTRQPRRLLSEVGWIGIARFTSVTLGPPVVSLLNLGFWLLTLMWEMGAPPFIRTIFPAVIFYPAITSLVLGNASIIYCGLIAARVDKKPYLLVATLTIPLYWLLMSVASVKAFYQLFFQPSYWEKTAHGLDHDA